MNEIFIDAESCTSGDLQLVNGSTSYEGRVEVCNSNHVWGTICADENWDPLDAMVICNQLGHGQIGTL